MAVPQLLFNPFRDQYIVLMYHYVFDPRPDRRGMHPRRLADFDRELDFLAKTYQVGTVAEVLAAARVAGPPTCALTFDDATRDQYDNAAPRLEARGWRGTFFVITDTLKRRLPFTHQLHLLLSFLDAQTIVGRYHQLLEREYPSEQSRWQIPTDAHLNPLRLHDDVYSANLKECFPALPAEIRDRFLKQLFAELKLTEEKLAEELFIQPPELKSLHRRGHAIGTHGQTHRPFDTLSLGEIKRELEQSMTVLTACLGEPPTILSYPYGRLSQELPSMLELVRGTGVRQAVIMDYRSVSAADDSLLIPRFNTNHIKNWLETGRL